MSVLYTNVRGDDADIVVLQLIFATVRADKPSVLFSQYEYDVTDIVFREVLDVLRSTLSSRAATWINLEPLSFTAISTMVSRTLHRPKEEVQSLSRVIHAASLGNAFSARNILTTLHRQRMVGPHKP